LEVNLAINVRQFPLDTDNEIKFHKKKLTAITGYIYNQMILDWIEDGKDITDQHAVSHEYCRRICRLKTEDLEYILWGHNSLLVMRRMDTLQAIEDELFERGCLVEE